ncbi:MAG: hypothetical protein ACI8WY_002734, partial [Planctomycetota bacterium]
MRGSKGTPLGSKYSESTPLELSRVLYPPDMKHARLSILASFASIILGSTCLADVAGRE